MERANLAKKYEADKIALLGLFVLGLLAAYFTTYSRHTGPRNAGGKIVAGIQQKGISALLEDLGWENFFLIRDAAGRTIGFTVDVFTNLSSQSGWNIQGADHLYIRGRYGWEQLMFFQSDEHLSRFSWQSRVVRPGRSTATQITLTKDGVVTVTGSGRGGKEQRFKPSSAFLPSPLLNLALSRMIEAGIEKIIVDLIEADGTISPMVISASRPGNLHQDQQKLKYKFSLKMLGPGKFSEVVYLDDQNRVSKVTLQGNNGYFLERTGRENVLRQFPERAGYILKQK